MAGSDDTFTVLLQEVAAAVLPVADELGSPERVLALLATLGVRVPAPPAALGALTVPVGELGSAAEQLVEVLGQPDPDPLEVIAKVVALGAGLSRVFQVMFALGPEVAAELAGEAELLARVDLAALGTRLADHLLITHVRQRFPPVYNLALLLGLFEVTPVQGDDLFVPAHVANTIRWDRLRQIVREPSAVAEELYRWGGERLDIETLLERLQYLLLSLAVPVGRGDPGDPILATLNPLDDRTPPAGHALRIPLYHEIGELGALEVGLQILPASPVPPDGGEGLAVSPFATAALAAAVPLSDRVRLNLRSDVDLSSGVAVVLRPPFRVELQTALLGQGGTGPAGGLRAELAIGSPDARLALAGQPGFFLVDAGGLALSGSVQLTGDGRHELALEFVVRDAALQLTTSSDDGFLARILPEGGIRAPFEIAVGWSSSRGVTVSGGAGLELTVPVHQSLLGLCEIESIFLALRAGSGGMELVIAISAKAKLGPLGAVVDRVGVRALATPAAGGGNLGPFDVGLRLKPPNGVGISLDGPVTGGGYLFFDEPKEQYGGVLRLAFGETLTLTAIGLLTTRLPDGGKGFSLLVIISASFSPLQLGMGFALTGVGGMIGINRRADEEVLRAGVRTGALDAVLFPDDPVGNAPQLVNTLNAVFPAARDRFVFGPMAKIAWGTPPIITLELGIILELPAPLRVFLVGRLRAALPDQKRALVRIRVDVAGVLDLGKGQLSIDASLHDSSVLQFVLTGDMALRLNWGVDPMFILSVGGFHPRFRPPPGLPKLERLAISLAAGENPRLRLETYLALTSNTAQIGARLELYAEAAGFSLEGHLGFDALFQFSPFMFTVDIDAGVTLRRGRVVLMSVQVRLSLSGPSPWRAWGRAEFTLLFITFSVGFDLVIGAREEPPAVEPVDLHKLLVEAFSDRRNWSAQPPAAEQMAVTLREVLEPQAILAHPLADLTVRQRVAPLDTAITRFGQTKLPAPQRFQVRVLLNQAEAATRPVVEQFAPAQFLELREDEKLSRPSFEPMPAGVRIGLAGVTHGGAKQALLQYQTLLVDAPTARARTEEVPYTMAATTLDALAEASAAGRSDLRATGTAKYRGPSQRVTVQPTGYVVASVVDLRVRTDVLVPDGTSATGSYTAAREALDRWEREHPEERDGLQVLERHLATAP